MIGFLFHVTLKSPVLGQGLRFQLELEFSSINNAFHLMFISFLEPSGNTNASNSNAGLT